MIHTRLEDATPTGIHQGRNGAIVSLTRKTNTNIVFNKYLHAIALLPGEV